jgi:hypothetical protein
VIHALIIIENEDARRAENVLRLYVHQLADMRVQGRKTVFNVTLDGDLTLDELVRILSGGGLDVVALCWP